jgi:ABC-type antimicrobial peptide transport system ATPase subunit
MWADNETEVDLLGFDFLVDTLFVAVTEPRLLPLTVGLLGDWGSGKSSLMRITRHVITPAAKALIHTRRLLGARVFDAYLRMQFRNSV